MAKFESASHIAALGSLRVFGSSCIPALTHNKARERKEPPPRHGRSAPSGARAKNGNGASNAGPQGIDPPGAASASAGQQTWSECLAEPDRNSLAAQNPKYSAE